MIIIVSCFSVISGCNKPEFFKKDDFVTYTIPAGKHRSTRNVRIFSQDELKFTVKFDSSAIYTTIDPVNQHATNKLFGFSDCNTTHRENSARVGWRWLNNRLEILAYCYINSEMKFEVIETFEIGEEYECSIITEEENYQFIVNGTALNMPRECSETSLRYYLYPYFGGREAAPHDIYIKIKEL